MRLVLKTLFSYHWCRPGQTLFLLIGLVSGLSLLVAVQVINDTARASYQDANQLLDYQLNYLITSTTGNTIPLGAYIALRRAGFDNIAPVLERRVRGEDGSILEVIATDLFAFNNGSEDDRGIEDASSSTLARINPGEAFSSDAWLRFTRPPYQSYVPSRLAQNLGITEGDSLVTREGIYLPPSKLVESGVGESRIFLDIGVAMNLFGQDGFDYIGVIGGSVDVRSLADQFRVGEFGSLQVETNTQALDLTQLTDSFHINLTAMSLLSLAVGLFIIYNAAQFSVFYRRASIRTLRVCGVSFIKLGFSLAIEFLIWVLVGTVLACTLGYYLGSSLLPSVSGTLNELYDTSIISGVRFNPDWLWQTLLVALTGMAFAIALPMWDLIRTKAINRSFSTATWDTSSSQKRKRWLSIFTILCLILLGSSLLGVATNQDLSSAFGGLAALLLAGALILPLVLNILVHIVICWIPESCNKVRWVLSDITLQLPRTRIAFMAILLALVANIGVNLMVNSFRAAFTHWMDYRLTADVYVIGSGGSEINVVDLNGVSAFFLTAQQTISWKNKKISLRGIDRQDPAYSDPSRFIHLMTGNVSEELAVELLAQWHRGQGVFINEQMHNRQDIGINDEVILATSTGEKKYPVLGMVHDYGNTEFEVYLTMAEFRQSWPSARVTGLGLILDQPYTEGDIIEQLVQQGIAEQRIRLQLEIKQIANSVFERTFLITTALNSLTLLIAGVSMLCALLALQSERASFIGNLLSMGVRRSELITAMAGVLLSKFIVTILLAMPLSYLFAWVLIEKINILSFGWTMPLVWQGPSVLISVGVALLILLSSIFPVFWLLKRKPLRRWLANSEYTV